MTYATPKRCPRCGRWTSFTMRPSYGAGLAPAWTCVCGYDSVEEEKAAAAAEKAAEAEKAATAAEDGTEEAGKAGETDLGARVRAEAAEAAEKLKEAALGALDALGKAAPFRRS